MIPSKCITYPPVLFKKSEISLLRKGLNFAPTTGPNEFQLFLGLHCFIRKITLKRQFATFLKNIGEPSALEVKHSTTKESNLEDADMETLNNLENLWDGNLKIFLSFFCQPDIKHTVFKPKSDFYPHEKAW